ncbi:MAG: protein translocase subunit SecD [Caldilineaceae bacterium]|nr:protein translocase subunit SecD [Caldilineaceae bacterium]
MRNHTVALLSIAILAAFAIYIVLPVPHPDWLVRSDLVGKPTPLELKLGLDLQGGTQVMLEADLPEGKELQDGAMDTAKIIVERRVNGLGVSEAVVQAQGESRITAELPGVSNPDQAVETIRSTGQLEFVDPQGATLSQGMVINTTNKPDAVQQHLEANGEGPGDPALAPYGDRAFQTVMTGDVLRTAIARQDQFNQWEIGFELTGSGSEQFYSYTSTHVGQPMAIVLDGVVLSAPVINSAIRDQGVITGQFSRDEAESLAIQMRYGALPVPLKVVDVRSISASLGQDSVRSSVIAGFIGMGAVFLFMLFMYRIPGLLADLALVLYIFFNLAIYKVMPVTLTLAGITGFLLSVGMAVDANILIFERLKEELRSGRSPRLAVEAGFSRAWPAILDSNLTTLISCAVLYVFGNQFGASIVKGYALTLGIGVLLSMLTAVFVTRSFMRTLLGSRPQQDHSAQTIVGY